jgi:crossover junction endodeoxyribonuclease RusA
MIVKLPFPPSELMPNRRLGKHWGSTHDIKTGSRDGAYKATQEAMQTWKEPEGNIPVSILFLSPDKRHRDLDNCLAASKAALDGIAKALGVDDKRFRPIMIDEVYSGGLGGTVVAINVEVMSFRDMV